MVIRDINAKQFKQLHAFMFVLFIESKEEIKASRDFYIL
jgi:hypothetical protein